MDELAWNIITLGSGMTMNNSEMTVDGITVYTGNYTPVAGMNNFVFSTPVTYNGGDLVVTWCYDNGSYVSGNNMFESTQISGTLSNYLTQSLLKISNVGISAKHGHPRKGEQRRSAINSKKLANSFGWKPKVSLEEGLVETFNYFKDKAD